MKSFFPKRTVAGLDALPAEVDALKRLQAETTVNNTGQAAAELELEG